MAAANEVSPIAAALSKAPFRVGQKQIYLPKFNITLHRSTNLGPKYAKFTVPLWFNKLDLRDYLFHAYDVRILSVRSYVKLQRVKQGNAHPDYDRPQPNRWHRPQSIKTMTVELDSPFIWPEEPTDLSPWEQTFFDKRAETNKAQEETQGRLKDAAVDQVAAKAMREQAKRILQGKEQWQGSKSRSFGPVLQR